MFHRLRLIEEQAGRKGRTMLEHALFEVLRIPPVVSVVAGVRCIDQLDLLIAAVEG
jgi:aryl-alcohol dehydrogenase-like predicted oxidoreductase